MFTSNTRNTRKNCSACSARNTRNTRVANATPSALSHDIAGQTINLNLIPEDIHRLILSDLADTSPADVLKVAHSSRTLRDAALPFIYRNITLTGGPETNEKQTAYQALVESLRQDEHGKLARHVRSITVKNEVPTQDLIMILNKISQHGNLRWLNWETSAHMPRTVFDMIHATWPKLDIRVVVADRQNAKVLAHQQMDTRLLSSPLLVSLTYVVYFRGYDESCHSDWPRLSQALAAGGNVRSLRLQSLQVQNLRLVPKTGPENLPRLNLTPDLRLPYLEEITFQILEHWGASTYLWDIDHCRMFCDSIDCSRLRKLDFGTDNPAAFFMHFTGLCPKLKALSFGAAQGAMEPARRFIESVDALEHLDVSRAQLGIDDLWPVIEKHKDTLKTLILGPTLGRYCDPIYMDLSRLEAIALTFPKLERLGWDAPCELNIDAKHLELLSSMKLTKLDLYLHIPAEASDYSVRLVQNAMGSIAHPELNQRNSITAAINIAEVLSKSQHGVLQWLTLHLSRTGYSDRYQPWIMRTRLQLRRNSYAGKVRERKWDVRGGLDWDDIYSLGNELQFVDA